MTHSVAQGVGPNPLYRRTLLLKVQVNRWSVLPSVQALMMMMSLELARVRRPPSSPLGRPRLVAFWPLWRASPR